MPRDVTTTHVIDRFNQAFLEHDPGLLVDVVGPGCVIEDTTPAPDGARREGREECLRHWQRLAGDRSGSFELEDVHVAGERATILWRYRSDDTDVRGVNLMRVCDGRVVEARGYVKAG